MSPIPSLQIEKINVGYGDIRVLWDVSFKVDQGQIVSLIGSNGAGKTTTLKTIAGLLKPSSGKILFGDRTLSESPVEKVVESGVVYVPEGRGIFPEMTVEENLEMGSYTKHARENHSKSLKSAFSLFPKLESRRKQLAGTLSGGEAQMLAIGRGMMSSPKILMLDEPSAGISPILADSVFAAIERLREDGITILIVEQDAGRALKLSDTAYVLENGKITLEGRGLEMLHNDYVMQAYLGL
ncbi:MAG: ABC transporter ATP-binding protein [Nitrososphaerales archaeon]